MGPCLRCQERGMGAYECRGDQGPHENKQQQLDIPAASNSASKLNESGGQVAMLSSDVTSLYSEVAALKASFSNIEGLLALLVSPNTTQLYSQPRYFPALQAKNCNPNNPVFSGKTTQLEQSTSHAEFENGTPHDPDSVSLTSLWDFLQFPYDSPTNDPTAELLEPPRGSNTIENHENAQATQYSAILEVVSTYVSPESATIMAEFLEHHYSSRQSRITGLRAGVLPALSASEGGCPIVEWREDPETNVTAIFKMDVAGAQCSCLLHYGVGNSWQSDGNRWRRSSLAWNVITIGHLKNLLEAAQHMLGMQHWFDPNLMRRFCENSRTDCTQEE
jgi:hypothetical protein